MENLSPRRRLVHRTAVVLAVWYFMSCTTAIVVASGMFQDQIPKSVSSETYYKNLIVFSGQSLTAMSLSDDGSQLNLGAKNGFHILDVSRLGDPSAITNVSWVSETTVVDECKMKGKQGWQCQNFIQVVLKNNATNRLLVCGTNAWAPSCRNFQPNSLTEYDVFSGLYRCPFSPAQRSTALFADGALYTATVTSFTAVDSIIFRSLQGEAIRTKQVDTKWLKVPEFIKSFEVGEWVIFFLREIAVEHVNSGEAIYSRVAKVCKNDIGGSWLLADTWTTFQKARLNCSFPGAFPFYFNYLQDVHMVGEGDDVVFYGVFTTGDHEIPGSAVCVFSLAKIKEIINEDKFKAQDSGTWYPVPVNDVPTPRPGICAPDSKDVPDPTLDFILEHPLMDQSVPNLGDDRPRFDLTRADYRIMQIVVHQQRAADNVVYDVLFLGTDDGRVLKVVIVKDTNGQFRSNLLEEIFISSREDQEGVVNMEIIKSPNGSEFILVNTNSTLVQLPLQRCENLKQCACEQDPYCVFNRVEDECRLFANNDFDYQDVTNIVDCPEEVPVPQTTTPVECTCPTAQPCTETDLPSSMLPPAAATSKSSRTPPPTEAITTPSKGTPLQATESLTTTLLSRMPRTTDMSNVIGNKMTTPPQKTNNVNSIDNVPRGSVSNLKAPVSPLFWTFFTLGWLLAFILVVFLIHLYVSRRCKGNYQPTNTEDTSVHGSSYKPSPDIKPVHTTTNGKPPLMTSLQESPVRATPVNGSLPQSRTHSLTPSTDPNLRHSNGSHRRPNGSFTYGMDSSYLTPYNDSAEKRQPPTGGGFPVQLGSPCRLPSETESRPSASGASDSELFGEDSDIWLKMPDGTPFGQEHEV